MIDKALNLLQFAAKSGKLSYGTHATEWAIMKGTAKIVCIANDISAKTVKEMKFKAIKASIEVIVLENTDTETLSRALGRKCGIVSVNDDNFARPIKTTIEKHNLGGTAHDGEI